MLDIDYEIPKEKFFEEFDVIPLLKSPEMAELTKDKAYSKKPESRILVKTRLTETFDIDNIKKDTVGKDKFNPKKHLRKWKKTFKSTFKKTFVNFLQKETTKSKQDLLDKKMRRMQKYEVLTRVIF